MSLPVATQPDKQENPKLTKRIEFLMEDLDEWFIDRIGVSMLIGGDDTLEGKVYNAARALVKRELVNDAHPSEGLQGEDTDSRDGTDNEYENDPDFIDDSTTQ